MTLNMSTVSFASEVHTLSERPPISSEIVPYGTSAPSKNSIHDLSKNACNYNVESMGAALYTDKRFKNASSIYVDINDFAFKGSAAELAPKHKETITITLYNSKGKKVSSKSVTFLVGVDTWDSVSFKDLDENEQYYIKFSSSSIGNRWSFYGSVTGE